MLFNVIDNMAALSGRPASARKLWRGIALRVAESGFAAAQLLIIGVLLARSFEGGLEASLLVWLTVTMGFLLMGQFALSWAADRDTFGAGYRITNDLRIALADHMRKLPLGFFGRRKIGDLTNIVSGNMKAAEELFTHLLSIMAGGFAAAFWSFLFLLVADWRSAAVMAGFLAVGLSFLAGFRAYFDKVSQSRIAAVTEAGSRLLEYVQGIKTIRAFDLTGPRFARLDQALRRQKSVSLQLETAGGGALSLFGFVLEAGFLAVLVWGAFRLADGSLTPPVYGLALIFSYRFHAPIIENMVFLAEASYMKRNVDRISSVMGQAPLKDPSSPKPVASFGIEFKNVSFSHDGEDMAIKNVSCRFAPGAMTALVGPSGSGKSTLLRLIARFDDPTSGEVRIGGEDLRDVSVEAHLRNISIVFQDVYLFNATVRENIGIGRPEASEEDIIAAAKAAQAHDFIMSLPQGYDTVVGEAGASLSGGERQRISIARAVLKDAPVILLDEATSAMDPENEVAVQQALARLIAGKAAVVIAHRLSTVVKADKILVLDGGSVAEEGAHDELLARGGAYSRLWSA